MRFNFQQSVSYCLGVCAQNPVLREVDLKPSPKRGSDKINMQKQWEKSQMEEVINDNAININNIDKDDSENNSMNCDTCFYFSLSRSLFFTFY